MLSGTRLLNLSALMMKSGTYTHSKWSEYMVTNQRHFSLKSCSGVDNVRRVPISGWQCSPMDLPKWNTQCSINVLSYRCISTTGMFFGTPPNGTDPSANGNNQLPIANNSSNGQSNGPANRSHSIISWMRSWGEEWWKVAKVDEAILKGTSPNPIPIHSPVDRQEIINKLISRFINKKDADKWTISFGVILGPTGTGKTHIVTQACRQHPKGVLYYDILTDGDNAKYLAEVAGMRTEPTLLGKLAGYFFGSPIGHYKIPDVDALAITYVTKEIAKRSEELEAKLGRPACLFIDGVDIIAKNDKDLFIKLVDLAKGLANKGSLRMILVSSEGHIIPLLKETSSQSRSDVMEILDITEDQAIKYLCDHGLPDKLAEDIVALAGPRVLFCYHAIKEYHEDPEKEDVLNRIVNRLHTKFVNSATRAFIMGKPATTCVIQALLESENANTRFDPFAFLEACSDKKERAKLDGAIDTLVRANALRYCADSTVDWHNKLARTDILKRLNK